MPLYVVCLEDEPRDAELVEAMLASDGLVVQMTRIDTEAAFRSALQQAGVELILADYSLPGFDGLSALHIARETRPGVPFIFVSGTLGEEVAIDAMKLGATDYVLKHHLSRLPPAVRRALREAQERADRERAERVLAGEKQVLETIARAEPLRAILDALCRLVEDLAPGSLASILLVDATGKRLRHGAAPSLPPSYVDAIDGLVVGAAAGSCGTAVHRNEAVIVADIADDPLWVDQRALALAHGLRACWSTPVRAPDGRVLASVAVYARAPGRPAASEREIIDRITDLASIAIERQRAEDERQAHLWLLESMDRVNQAIQSTNDLERMMSVVLEAMLAIFVCDRAWLVYPCDPDAPSCSVPMEHTRPSFPGLFALGGEMPVDAETAGVFRDVLASPGPVRFGPASDHALPPAAADRFGFQSMIAMAVRPKGDRPYMLGLHHCAVPHQWTPTEERLFQEIGRRFEDALTSLLTFRGLRESERRLDEAQRISHVGYWERDLATDSYTGSEETYRIFGLEPRTVTVGDVLERVHPADRERRMAAMGAAMAGGAPYDLEYRVIRPGGDLRFVHSRGNVLYDDAGKPRRMFGTVQDITERKVAEQRLVAQYTVTNILATASSLEEAASNILRAVCESLDWDVGALWRVDHDADVLRCVQLWHVPGVDVPEFAAATRVRTFSSGVGVPGRAWSSRQPVYVQDVVRDRAFPRAPIAAREGLHSGFGIPILLGRDVVGVMDFFSNEIRPPDRDLVDMMASIGSQIGQFIERKRAEDSLAHAHAELAHVARVAMLGEMSASIAHEINQPLAAIVNNATACLNWLDQGNFDEAREPAEQVIADAHRAADVIASIRSLAKKDAPEKDLVDVNAIIREVLALIGRQLHDHGIAVRTGLGDHLPPVLADRVQLQQVLLNLLMNAIEAMTSRREGAREIALASMMADADAVMISVADSGPGISPEAHERLFQAFQTTKPHGIGLGLAISRSIVEAHGGRLWADANEPRGAVFRFTLPIGDRREDRDSG